MEENTRPQRRRPRKEVSPEKLKRRKINRAMWYTVIVVSALFIVAVGFNIVRIMTKQSVGSGEVLQSETGSMKNDEYFIGNNPTDLQRDYYKGLTSALKEDDPLAISEQVVKCFIADYFTWTNKDGNYDVGGLSYMWGPKYKSFQEQSRYEFYKDLDLYLSQYEREELLQVKEVTTTSDYSRPFEFTQWTQESVLNKEGKYDVVEKEETKEYESYYVYATWTYEKAGFDTSSFMHEAEFTVSNRDGRYEISQIFPTNYLKDNPELNALEKETESETDSEKE